MYDKKEKGLIVLHWATPPKWLYSPHQFWSSSIQKVTSPALSPTIVGLANVAESYLHCIHTCTSLLSCSNLAVQIQTAIYSNKDRVPGCNIQMPLEKELQEFPLMRNPATEEGAPSCSNSYGRNSDDASKVCKPPRESDGCAGKTYMYILVGSDMLEAQREHWLTTASRLNMTSMSCWKVKTFNTSYIKPLAVQNEGRRKYYLKWGIFRWYIILPVKFLHGFIFVAMTLCRYDHCTK